MHLLSERELLTTPFSFKLECISPIFDDTIHALYIVIPVDLHDEEERIQQEDDQILSYIVDYINKYLSTSLRT